MSHAPVEKITGTDTVACRESGSRPWDGPEADTVPSATLADLEEFTRRLRGLGATGDQPCPLPGPLRVTLERW